MQRLGLVIWTGDIQVSWESMQHQPAYATAWTLAGTPYVTCDIGGFSGPDDPADLLARWYQSGALLPIMRVHSDLTDRPHFPFLYNDQAATAMRNALHLRYQLLPYTYSLAHAAYEVGTPLARPLYYQYPNDGRVLSITDQWFFGPSIMATPILTSSDGSSTDTARQVYLPTGLWYQVIYSANLSVGE
jgi:alpha-glucosidase